LPQSNVPKEVTFVQRVFGQRSASSAAIIAFSLVKGHDREGHDSRAATSR
jgi:hypothetical protein